MVAPSIPADSAEERAHDQRLAVLRAFHDRTREVSDEAEIVRILSGLLAAPLGISHLFYGEAGSDDTEPRVIHAAAGRLYDDAGALPLAAAFRSLAAGEVRRSMDDGVGDTRPPGDPARIVAERLGVRAGINMPIIEDGRVLAILSAFCDLPRAWARHEIELFEELAEYVWATVSRVRAQAALRTRERNGALLIDWSDKVRRETSPQAVMATTLAWLGRHLGVTRVTYSENDASGRVFTVLDEWRDGVGSNLGNTITLGSMGRLTDAEWLGGELVRYDDVTADPRVEPAALERYAATQIRAFISVPLLRDGGRRSIVSVQDRHPRRWRDGEVQLMRDIAERALVSLERARAEAALKDRERNQAFLVEWSDAVRDETGARALLGRMLELLGRHLRVSRANFAEAIDDGETLCVLQEWCEGVVGVKGERFPLAALGERVAALTRSGGTLRVDDIARHPLFDDANRPLYEAVGVRAALTVPMVRNGRVTAVLSVQQASPRAWTDGEEALLRDIADRTLAVLERARSEERLAESEAQLAAFLDNAPLVMHMKDEAGRYIRINPEFARAMGRPAAELIGRHPSELFSPGLAAQVDAIERRALAGEVASGELEIGTGERYASVLSIVFPIAGSSGVARTAGFTIDLTERKRAEAALARSRETLYQTEKLSALGSLLAGVSHELNNPLSIVVAQSVMMERQGRGTELAERAQKIRKAADRCARIVQTFLAMARQKRPARTAVDVNAVVIAALELAEYGLRTDGIATVRELAEGLPPISADSDQLHQIVLNLVVNAQQAMADAASPERRLTLRTARGRAAGTVIVEVADTGPGVPEEARRRVFEPFYTTKPQGQGTGVGLSFSQGLAEAHGGRLDLLRTSGGACFRLTLPIDDGVTVPAGAAELTPEREPAARRALVVDDEAEIAEALADFLSLEGFACDVAVGGEAARARLAGGQYDLIVSDLRMPDVDGPALHAWLAAERPDLAARMAFTTGDTLGLAAERFLDEVRRPVLEKPFMPDAVHRFLQQMDLA